MRSGDKRSRESGIKIFKMIVFTALKEMPFDLVNLAPPNKAIV